MPILPIERCSWAKIKFVSFKYGIQLDKRDFSLFHQLFTEVQTVVVWYMICQMRRVLSIWPTGNLTSYRGANPITLRPLPFWSWATSAISAKKSEKLKKRWSKSGAKKMEIWYSSKPLLKTVWMLMRHLPNLRRTQQKLKNKLPRPKGQKVHRGASWYSQPSNNQNNKPWEGLGSRRRNRRRRVANAVVVEEVALKTTKSIEKLSLIKSYIEYYYKFKTLFQLCPKGFKNQNCLNLFIVA